MVYTFWVSAIFLVYVFAGYPALLFMLAKLRGRPHWRQPIEPNVSLVVAAHNEERFIGRKILNCLELDYPREKLEIIVASDGSSDRTAEIARSFEAQGLRVVESGERWGKQHAQMLALKASRGEVIVFTDVGTLLEPEGLQRIVANFADPAVGSVSSEDCLSGRVHGGERFYVGLEMWLRRLESRVGTVVSASGSFFAARRSVCENWHLDQTSDFFVPLHAISMGMRAVVDPASVGLYAASQSQNSELHRKVRTIVNGLHVFFAHARLLNPFRYGLVSWQLVSHKLCRWLIPFAMLALLIASLALWSNGVFYRLCASLLVAGLAIGVLGLAAGRLIDWKPLRLASYLLLGNAATVMAWSYFISGERFVTWQPTRRV